MTDRVGIIAALPGELKPLVRGWETRDVEGCVIYRTLLDGTEVVATCCGMGREPAARACLLAMEGGRLSAIASVGWAGALSCGMKAGEAYTVHEVIDGATGERYQTATEAPGRDETPVKLITTKRIAGKAEKRQLAENYGALLVDMEAATVGRLARVHGIPFYCLKAVSDGANELLPDMNPFLTRAGQMRVGRLAASVAVRPQYWAAMARMGRNSRLGAETLGVKIRQLVEESRHANDHQGV